MSSTTPTNERATVSAHGAEIPKLGFGTFEVDGDEAERAVRDALEIGYRHIDTARAYANERQVGKAIADSGVDRGEIFLTTKLWFEDLSRDGVREQLDGSLSELGVDYVDLLLVHWPNPDFSIAATLEAMAEQREREKVRHLGVSNFPTDHLEEALNVAPAPLVADQVEMHPYLDQTPLLELAATRGLAIEAYSPLAQGELLDDEALTEIGERKGKSAAQVALRWLIEHPQVAALPRSSSHEHRVSNFDVFDFELDEPERRQISALARDGRQIDPDFAPDWD